MSDSMPHEGPVRQCTPTSALCCRCGRVRTVIADLDQLTVGPYGLGEGWDAADLAELQAQGLNLGMEPFWRGLCTLSCSACERLTRHAVIRQDEDRDHAERQDRQRDLSRRELRARLARLELAGIDIRWDDGKDWPQHAVIELYQYRDPSGQEWLVVLSQRARPDALMQALHDVERTIDRQELTCEWRTDPGGSQWRGRRFHAT